MEKEEEKILDTIEKDIHDEAELVISQINSEVENMRAEQIHFFQEGLKKETDTYLEKELNDLRLLATTKASQGKLKTKRDLLSLRASLITELFEQCRQDLIAFTKSADYDSYLEQHLSCIPQVSPQGVFYARQEDIEKLKTMMKKKGWNNEVQPDILPIGGFRYVDFSSHLQYSCSLEEKRLEQMQWFRDHSGFTIDEGGDNQ